MVEDEFFDGINENSPTFKERGQKNPPNDVEDVGNGEENVDKTSEDGEINIPEDKIEEEITRIEAMDLEELEETYMKKVSKDVKNLLTRGWKARKKGKYISLRHPTIRDLDKTAKMYYNPIQVTVLNHYRNLKQALKGDDGLGGKSNLNVAKDQTTVTMQTAMGVPSTFIPPKLDTKLKVGTETGDFIKRFTHLTQWEMGLDLEIGVAVHHALEGIVKILDEDRVKDARVTASRFSDFVVSLLRFEKDSKILSEVEVKYAVAKDIVKELNEYISTFRGIYETVMFTLCPECRTNTTWNLGMKIWGPEGMMKYMEEQKMLASGVDGREVKNA